VGELQKSTACPSREKGDNQLSSRKQTKQPSEATKDGTAPRESSLLPVHSYGRKWEREGGDGEMPIRVVQEGELRQKSWGAKKPAGRKKRNVDYKKAVGKKT